jgi:tetratricopeptide (TPR) repeat protein
MDLNEAYNPFDFANPVMEANLLVGREKEMDEIKYYLDNTKNAPRPINIALLGPRASGKTSILNITELEAKARGFFTVRINFDEDDAKTPLAFFHKLFDSIISEACQRGAFEGIDGKTYDLYLDAVNAYSIPEDKTFCPFSFPIQYAKAMSSGNSNAQISDYSIRSDLIKVHEELKVPIVLLFDEGNVLAQSRVLLEKLRNVFMNTPGFMLVMTGTPDLFPVMDDVFSPIVRQFKKINVGEFSKFEDTRECIIKPLQKLGSDLGEKLSRTDVQEIHNLSGGRPYEIQLICHMLFKRLQLRRSNTMKLDFSVLEEVRRELETWQDITSRPILTKVRNLNKKQLDALRILCSCNSRATFDQVWSLEYIFKGDELWKKEALKYTLNFYLDEEILKIKNDFISFAGDDFDKIYVKYLAREKNIALDFSPFSLELRWRNAVNEFIRLHVEDSLERIYFALRLTFTDILNIIREMDSLQPSGDIFVDQEDLAGQLYFRMVKFKNQAVFPVFAINPNLPWLNIYTLYCPRKPEDFEALEEIINLTRSLSENVANIGGSLIVERWEFPIVSLSTLVNNVERSANKNLRESLAKFHIMNMSSVYIEEADREEALLHANISLRYNPEPDFQASNNIGYVLLGADDLDRAEFFFKRSIELCRSDEPEDVVFPALPIYNLGSLRAQSGFLESALADFQSCISLTQDLNPKERSVQCLWVPIISNKVLEFVERSEPDLLETAKEAKTSMEYILTNKGDD